MPEIPADVFSLNYDAAQHLLVGHWLRDSGEEDLYPSYERLLATAKAHGNCRFWLLDMQLRNWHTATFTKWFSELLTNQAVREVGSPIFVAYVAAEIHRAEIESVSTAAMLRQSAQAEFYPFFFNSEAAAREWLAYYQSHPGQAPPTPVA
ncbi:MAG: hypothetical protein EOO36_17715 [Cytophagaceae bacterium]|nr:MAG: hypothetical protein EOO36_17715 [Cytophagaceae bacterium]